MPALIAANVAGITWAIRADASLSTAALVLMFSSLAYLFVLERAIPYQKEWHPNRREWLRNGLYFLLNGGVTVAVQAGVMLLAIELATGDLALPLATQLPLAFLVSTFVNYWTHRLGHSFGFLWKMHGIHHTPKKVNAANNNVIHFLDLVFQTGTNLTVMLVIGFSAEAVFATGAIGTAFSFASHANADVRLGFFNYVIGGPEQHRLHHSIDVKEAGHFSSTLPMWDLVFGSFTWRPKRTSKGIGIAEPSGFPDPNAFLRSAAHPMRSWWASVCR